MPGSFQRLRWTPSLIIRLLCCSCSTRCFLLSTVWGENKKEEKEKQLAPTLHLMIHNCNARKVKSTALCCGKLKVVCSNVQLFKKKNAFKFSNYPWKHFFRCVELLPCLCFFCSHEMFCKMLLLRFLSTPEMWTRPHHDAGWSRSLHSKHRKL